MSYMESSSASFSPRCFLIIALAFGCIYYVYLRGFIYVSWTYMHELLAHRSWKLHSLRLHIDQIDLPVSWQKRQPGKYFSSPLYIKVKEEKPLLLTFGPRLFQHEKQWTNIFSVLKKKISFAPLWGSRKAVGYKNADGELLCGVNSCQFHHEHGSWELGVHQICSTSVQNRAVNSCHPLGFLWFHHVSPHDLMIFFRASLRWYLQVLLGGLWCQVP